MARYIDAEALINELTPDPIIEMGCPEPEGLSEFSDWLDMAPTADVVEVRHGEWVIKHGRIYCSMCGAPAINVETGCSVNRHHEQFKTNFCYDCGAKMDGGKNENWTN